MNYSDILYKSSPEYVKAYTEGFETMKVIALQEIIKLGNKIKNMQAYAETTATLTTNQTA